MRERGGRKEREDIGGGGDGEGEALYSPSEQPPQQDEKTRGPEGEEVRGRGVGGGGDSHRLLERSLS